MATMKKERKKHYDALTAQVLRALRKHGPLTTKRVAGLFPDSNIKQITHALVQLNRRVAITFVVVDEEGKPTNDTKPNGGRRRRLWRACTADERVILSPGEASKQSWGAMPELCAVFGLVPRPRPACAPVRLHKGFSGEQRDAMGEA